jgi:hypothetical protein
MDKQQVTGAVFVDLKKAFDLVDHECLFYKLEHYGIRGQTLSWFRNHLANRTQRVNYANELSPSRVLNYGVPQGSVLGPLLFVIHINGYPDILPKDTLPKGTLPKDILPNGHFADGHFAERTFCRTNILPNGQFAERTVCRTDSLPNGQFAERTTV